MKAELIDHMGSDLTVVNAARVSFAKESKYILDEGDCNCEDSTNLVPVLSPSDAKLIRYLAKHNHWTPFGHVVATFRLTMPIFIARQWMRSNIGIVYNEESRRYISDDVAFYNFDQKWRSRPDGSMKQGSGGLLADEVQGYASQAYWRSVASAERTYHYLLSINVAPEQARAVLPLAAYTSMYMTLSLAACARICGLRTDSHAQGEIQDLAAQVSVHMGRLFPISWAALVTKEIEQPKGGKDYVVNE